MKIYFYEVKDYEKEFVQTLNGEYGYEIIGVTSEPLTMENVGNCLGCDAVSTLGFSRCDAEMMKLLACHGTKYLATRTVGFNHVDLASARENGITVLHADYDSTNVADFTVMLMLMVIRKCKVAVMRTVVNNFSLDGIMGKDLCNMTVGIIGTGKIGTSVIKNLSGFGCKILCNDKFQNKTAGQYAEYCSLEKIYSECDIISLHMPLFEENFHMINAQTISKMKKGVIIINTARGGLIDTEALISAVESGQVGGVGLDTVEGEEGICHNDIKAEVVDRKNFFYLKQFPNVIYTPHIGFFTEEAVYQMTESAFKGIALCEKGEDNKYIVK